MSVTHATQVIQPPTPVGAVGLLEVGTDSTCRRLYRHSGTWRKWHSCVRLLRL